MKITEPMTLATDYLLAGWCLFLVMRLHYSTRWNRCRSAWFWEIGFFFIGVSALLGGTYHGFQCSLELSMREALWNATLYLIGVGSGFMVAGTCTASLKWGDSNSSWLLAGLAVSVVSFVIQQSGLVLFEHFNHNDLYHCLQIIGLYFFYRAALFLRDN